MENILQNQGIKHIAEKILTSLDSETVLKCRVVSKSLKNVIDNPRLWLKNVELTGKRVIPYWGNINMTPLKKCGGTMNETVESSLEQLDIKLIKSWRDLILGIQFGTKEYVQASLCLLRLKIEFGHIRRNANLLSPVLNAKVLANEEKIRLIFKVEKNLRALLQKTPLQTASENQSYELAISYLKILESKSRLNLFYWQIPLQIAAKCGHIDGVITLKTELRHRLLDYYWFTQFSEPYCLRDSDCMLIKDSPFLLAVKSKNVKVVEILLPLVEAIPTEYKEVLERALFPAIYHNGDIAMINLIHAKLTN